MSHHRDIYCKDYFEHISVLATTGPIDIPLTCTSKKALPHIDTPIVSVGNVVMGESGSSNLVITNKARSWDVVFSLSLLYLVEHSPAFRTNSRSTAAGLSTGDDELPQPILRFLVLTRTEPVAIKWAARRRAGAAFPFLQRTQRRFTKKESPKLKPWVAGDGGKAGGRAGSTVECDNITH